MAESIYSRHWDQYIEREWDVIRQQRGDEVEWPGDEWGNPEAWEHIFQTLFVRYGAVDTWQRAVEIGQGAGKYTVKVLGNPDVNVRAYDVSARFLEVCAERCQDHVKSGRLDLRQIDVSAPDFLMSDLQDWRRQIDALYSIDAMVHVDLQYLMAYLITAAALLRQDGKLVMTLATTGTEEGFTRLANDVSRYWSAQGRPTGSGKLEWVSGSMLESLLPRLGFEIDFLWEPSGIFVLFVASLRRPEVGDELASNLLAAAE